MILTFVSPKSLESKSKCLHIKPTVNKDLSKVGFLFGSIVAEGFSL